MPETFRNTLKYSCNCKDMQLNPTCFKKVYLQDTFTLNETSPDIGQIIRAAAEVCITCKRVISTQGLLSFDSQLITGSKLFFTGQLEFKMEYVADLPNGSIYAVCLRMPFSSFITLPEDYSTGVPMIVSGHIMNYSARIADSRNVFVSSMVLTDVIFHV